MQVNADQPVAPLPELSVDVQLGEGVEQPAEIDLVRITGQAFDALVHLGCADSFLDKIEDRQNALALAVCIRLVDAAEGEALNSQWRGKAYATNILSFTADVVVEQFAPLGDLVLCLPVVVAEAQDQGKGIADHFTHLVVHGLLHLLGFDHVEESEAEAMEAMEVTVLSGLGVDNPYE